MGDPNTGEVYNDFIRKPDDIGLDAATAKRLRELEQGAARQELQQMAAQREAVKPDLRTLEGSLSYLDYHAPNPDTLPRHERVNNHFQRLLADIWSSLPDGPGKTVAVRAIGRARMECNSCIANGGQ